MMDSLFSIGIVSAIALTCLGLGRPIARALRGADEDGLTETVWSLALGLIAAGMLLTLAGLLGWLDATAIRAATAAGSLAGLFAMCRMRRTSQSRSGEVEWSDDHLLIDVGRGSQPPRWLTRGLTCLATTAAAAALASALAPATAGDALCYHLELPKRFLQSGSLDFLPYHENSTFPLLAEMWFLWAIALEGSLIGGGVAAQLVHFGLGLLFAFSAALLARPMLGSGWGRIVGCLVLIVPGVTNQMTAPLNDVALALFTTLALSTWREAIFDVRETGVGSSAKLAAEVSDNEPRLFILAGIALGAALGIKFLAIVFAAAVGVAIVWDFWRHCELRRKLVSGAAVVAVVAASIGGVWYVRSAWHRGNPVYPFFGGVLGGDGPEAFRQSKTPLANRPFDVALAPWQVTMRPDRFGGRGHQLGPLFLMLLPGLAISRRLRGLTPLLLIAAAYVVVWYLLRQNLRFLLPIVPLLTIAGVWVWIETARAPRTPSAVARFACAAMVLFVAAIPMYRAREHWQVALGIEPRETWLERHDPSYLAAAYAQLNLPRDAKLLSQDYRAYYFACEVVRENVYLRRNPDMAACLSAEGLIQRLREDGFTHLLLTGGNSAAARVLLAASQREAAPVIKLLDVSATDSGGAPRRFCLLELDDTKAR